MKGVLLCAVLMCAVAIGEFINLYDKDFFLHSIHMDTKYFIYNIASASTESHVRVVRSPQLLGHRLRDRLFHHNGGGQQQQPLVAPPGGSAATANSQSRHFELRGPFGGGISFGRSDANSQAVSNGK